MPNKIISQLTDGGAPQPGDEIPAARSGTTVRLDAGDLALGSDVTAAVAALASVYQPLDSDLTAIAALSTTAFGRALLELADAAALLAAAGAAAATHVHAGEDVTSGTVADARIASTIARDAEVAASIAALSSVYQPLDSDLTSIAALTTTAFGRALLTIADQAALLAAAGAAAASHTHAESDITGLVSDLSGKQPLDSDLTAIAALSTTAFGRALLTMADAAATRTALGLGALATGDAAADVPITDTGAYFIATDVEGALQELGAGGGGGGGAPSGPAGGALDGSYPNPGLAATVAGAGLSEAADVLSVNVDGSTLEISVDTLRVKDGGITAAKVAADVATQAELDTHAGDTTSVHGIADTSALLDTADIGTTVQAHDADLDAVAALAPTNDDVIQRKAGAWTNRTLAQLIADLGALGTTFQPLDSDLTAIASLTTTAFGRGLLVLADQAALLAAAGAAAASHVHNAADVTTGTLDDARIPSGIARDAEVAASYQPLDSDLTAIAALTTTAYGRSLLEAASAAALRTLAGLVIGTDVQAFDQALQDIASLADPNADRLLFWDDSAGAMAFLTLGTNLSITGTTLDAAGGGGGGSGEALQKSISQTTHGFAVGDVVYYTGSAWAKAKADAAATAEVVGIVSAVADANTFTLHFGGLITGLSGLTAGSVYFLSPSTAGALTATEPSTVGHISKPLLVAASTTTGYFFNMRGALVTAAPGTEYSVQVFDAATTLLTGDGKAFIRIPSTLNGKNLVQVAAWVSTAGTSGTITVQLRRVRSATPADMLSTRITIDVNELDSKDAAAAAVIDTANDDVQTGDQVFVDVDVISTGAKGLGVWLRFA